MVFLSLSKQDVVRGCLRSKKYAFCGNSILPSVSDPQHQRLHSVSNFVKIRYRSYLKKIVAQACFFNQLSYDGTLLKGVN